MKKYWSKIIKKINPYIPGSQIRLKNSIKLNTNENFLSPSPKVLISLKKILNKNLRLYPNPFYKSLKKIISKKYNISIKKIFLGNGSDEIISYAFYAFFKKKYPILFPKITYNFYKSYAKLYNINYFKFSLTKKFKINIKNIFFINQKGGIILPNPNAPTGYLLNIKKIKNILNNNKNCIIIIDEAYIDFGGKTSIDLIKKYSNLLIIRTFSKSRSLASLRIGFALGNYNLIKALEFIKNSFNSYPLNRLSIIGGSIAMEDEKYFFYVKLSIIKNREILTKYLKEIKFKIFSSFTNFIFINQNKINLFNIFLYLSKKNIIIRYFLNSKYLKNFLRITIGNIKECKKTFFYIKKYISY